MIIVQLRGGFGNQLFQYAAGLSLATHHGVEVKVDTTTLGTEDELIGTLRNYELLHIVTPPAIASPGEIKNITHQPLLRKYFQKLLPPYRREIYRELAFTFDPHYFHAGGNLYLKGYRQSEQYFAPIRQRVQNDLFLHPSLYTRLQHIGSKLQNETSVAIHIRRGDYTDPLVVEYHGILDQSYYQAAIQLVKSKIDNPRFYVFSDDVKWAKQTLLLPEASFVSGDICKNAYEDFYLMSCCRHNIIANSSFSWWAAWFNKNKEKLVVAPKNWFKAPLETRDLIPSAWVRI